MHHRAIFRHTAILLAAVSSACLLSAQSATPAAPPAQPLTLPVVSAAIDCGALSSFNLSGAIGASSKIASAEVVNDGKSAPYCAVKVEIEGNINFDVRLPNTSWQQRLLFGGFGPGSQNGFVTVSWKDLGHRGQEDVFADNYQYRVNYGYRGLHLIVLASKALIGKYYNQAPKFSYYTACSEPGREGMMEVERFPEDFDGVVAGCAPTPMTVNNGLYHTWNLSHNFRTDGSSIFTADKLPLLHDAVVKQCDELDGVKDGTISDPFACKPQLDGLLCKPGQSTDACLTAEQLVVVKQIYQGANDGKGGKLAPGAPLPGSELAWRGVIAGSATVDPQADIVLKGTALAVKYLYSDPPMADAITIQQLNFDRALFDHITKQHYLYDSTDPDLTAFHKLGHKLILWHGLSDVYVPPAYSILYYAELQKVMGAKVADEFVRFYLYPGVFHCGGGDGPATHDFLTPIMMWVEKNVAPGVLMAEHFEGDRGAFGGAPAGAKPSLSRPIYPFPYTAKFTGKGDSKDAANFVQGPKYTIPADLYQWFGADSFYKPGYEKWCEGKGASFVCNDKR